MNRLLLLIFCFSFSIVSLAQDSKRESVEALLRIMKADSMIDSMYAQMDQMVLGMGQQLGVQPSEQALFDEYMEDVFASMKEDMSWVKIKDPVIDVYLKHYTEREIQDMLTFYKSESGLSMIEKMPAVMSDSMILTQNMLQSFLPKVQAMAQEFQKKLHEHRLHQRRKSQ